MFVPEIYFRSKFDVEYIGNEKDANVRAIRLCIYKAHILIGGIFL